MKTTWGSPQIEGDAIVRRATVTMEIRKIIAHPDRFRADVGDTYQGAVIVRDVNIPLNEIHLIEGGCRMILRYATRIVYEGGSERVEYGIDDQGNRTRITPATGPTQRLTCQACGATPPPNARYCIECGATL